MENLIELIKEYFKIDFDNNFENEQEFNNKQFFIGYLIDVHLVNYMKELIDNSNGDRVNDDSNILKFDTLVGIVIENFWDLYRRAQVLRYEDTIEYNEEQSRLKSIIVNDDYNIQYHDVIELFRNYIDSDMYERIESQSVSIDSIINEIFRSSGEKFNVIKKRYNVLKKVFYIFNYEFVWDLELLSDFDIQMRNELFNVVIFYLCLTKRTFIEFIDEIKDKLKKEIIPMIEHIYKYNKLDNEFEMLRRYINMNHMGKFGEKDKAKKCFAMLLGKNINLFSLSGDDRFGQKSGYAQIADGIKKKVFNNKYDYANLLSNTKRYVRIKKLGDVYEELNSPILFSLDNEVDKINSSAVGDAYGCCERKMLAWCEKHSLISESANSNLTFYIKYLPCEKCQPAIQNYNSLIYALYINYDDMVKKLLSNKPLEIRMAKRVNRYILK